MFAFVAVALLAFAVLWVYAVVSAALPAPS